jgi:hypothetical protein
VRLEAVRSHLSFDGNDVISNANIEASVGLDAIKNQESRHEMCGPDWSWEIRFASFHGSFAASV